MHDQLSPFTTEERKSIQVGESRWDSRTAKGCDRSHRPNTKKKLPTESCVGIATGKLVNDIGIVDPRAIIPGVRESMVALANDLSKASLLLFSGSGKGDCSP